MHRGTVCTCAQFLPLAGHPSLRTFFSCTHLCHMRVLSGESEAGRNGWCRWVGRFGYWACPLWTEMPRSSLSLVDRLHSLACRTVLLMTSSPHHPPSLSLSPRTHSTPPSTTPLRSLVHSHPDSDPQLTDETDSKEKALPAPATTGSLLASPTRWWLQNSGWCGSSCWGTQGSRCSRTFDHPRSTHPRFANQDGQSQLLYGPPPPPPQTLPPTTPSVHQGTHHASCDRTRQARKRAVLTSLNSIPNTHGLQSVGCALTHPSRSLACC
jgi:hypothetical protein